MNGKAKAEIEITVSPHQHAFLQAPFPKLFSGGVGAGKTMAGVLQALLMPPGSIGCVVAPTYTMLKDVILPAFERTGAVEKVNLSHMVITLKGRRTVLLRPAGYPDRLRGLNLDWWWLDEAVYCPEDVYTVLVGRLRREPDRYWLTTTPRRESWVYQRLVACEPRPVSLITAPTVSNPFISPRYAESLIARYGSLLARREVAGEWIDVSGTLFRAGWVRYSDALRYRPGTLCYLSVDLAIARRGKSHYTAIIVLRYDPQQRLYQVDSAIQGRWSFSEQVHMIRTLWASYQPTAVIIEINQYQRALAEYLAHEGLRVVPVQATAKKEERIQLLAPLYELGLITHAGRYPELEAQLLGYPDVEYDDLIDALAQAVQYAQAHGRGVVGSAIIKGRDSI